MPGSVQSVERAAAMIQLLAAESEPLGLGQVASGLGLAKGTVHGLLRTLCEVGFVEQEEGTGRYLLGSGLLHLGSTARDLNELRSMSLNWVDTLAARTGHSAGIAAYQNGRVVVAYHLVGEDGTVGSVKNGAELVLHASAFGKVIAAFDPGAARRIVGRELESLTFRTITQRSRLVSELAEVRDAGAATSVEEVEPGLAEIAAPIRDRGGYVVAAVGIDGTQHAVCDARLRPRAELVQEVIAVARSISRALGHGVEA